MICKTAEQGETVIAAYHFDLHYSLTLKDCPYDAKHYPYYKRHFDRVTLS